MTTCFLAPDPVQSTFFIPGGAVPGNGVQVFFYLTNTTTKQTAYKDNAAASSWTNPIVLDSGGNLPSGGSVWFPTGQTFTVVWAPSNDTDPPASPYRTLNNVSGVNDILGSNLGEWVQGSTPTFIGATSFTVTGDQTAIYTINRRLKAVVTAGTIYATIAGSSFGAGVTTVTVRPDSTNLDSGLSAVYYALLAADHVSVPVMPSRAPTVTSFTSSGTYSPTTQNVVAVLVDLIGGGGGGGSAASTGTASSSAGGGGGSGGFARGLFSFAQVSSGVSVTTGAGGTGAAGSSGTNGSTSVFGSLMFANGGVGGILSNAYASTSVLVGTVISAGRVSGAASSTGGYENLPGRYGDYGMVQISNVGGSGFGALAGSGGHPELHGVGGLMNLVLSGNSSTGAAGFRGGGGAGGASVGGAPAAAGGSGGQGYCQITEYY